MNYQEIRNKYPKFIYKSFAWRIEKSDLIATYAFSAGEHSFSPQLTFKNIDTERMTDMKNVVDNLVFNIGLVELLSYWKVFASPEISIECGKLDDYQILWWKDLLINGMGQYFYENNIDFTGSDFVNFVSANKSNKDFEKAEILSDSILVPVGGGKDSSVTLEILKTNFKNVGAFLLSPSIAAKETVRVSGVKQVVVERQIDEKLFDLNKQGFLNGHTPFTALLSFTSILSAITSNYGVVVFSNERSSNEDNTKFLGSNINHQYSKTIDFENKFRDYNARYLSNVEYFSFLRPIYDIQIAKIFSKFNNYFSVIHSCNVGQKTNTWCGKCPKCLSTFILFYPFLKEKTIDIFGKNLLEDKSLEPMLHTLTSEDDVKPFECVGTREELKVALGIIEDKSIMTSWNSDNNLPKKYEELLRKYI